MPLKRYLDLFGELRPPRYDFSVSSEVLDPPASMHFVQPCPNRIKHDLKQYHALTTHSEKTSYIVRTAYYWPKLLCQVMEQVHRDGLVKNQKKKQR